jgi:hypothetical protein
MRMKNYESEMPYVVSASDLIRRVSNLSLMPQLWSSGMSSMSNSVKMVSLVHKNVGQWSLNVSDRREIVPIRPRNLRSRRADVSWSAEKDRTTMDTSNRRHSMMDVQDGKEKNK